MSALDQAFDAEAFRQQGHALVDLLANYLNACQQRQGPVLPWATPDEQFSFWQSQEGETSFEALSQLLLERSMHTHHPRYVGHQVSPPAPTAALADLMASFVNNGMAVYEMGPASTAIERHLVQWLGRHAGWENPDGIIVSGGSIGNLTALLAARQRRAPFNAWAAGTKGGPQLAIMVSEEAHYCVSRSAQIMGLGEAGVIKVASDERLRMNPIAMREAYQQAISQGKHVFAIVGSACTTSTGSFDPLEEIAAFAQEKGLWFHIDAAHGGASLLSPQYKHLLNGAALADSMVIDFHKMMLCPALATATLFREPSDSYATFSQTAAYLLNDSHWYDLASRTIECTKRAISFKPYYLLRLYGEALFTEYIEKMYGLAADFANLIEHAPDFELLMQPSCNIVCFRYLPGSPDANALNASIRQRLIERGHFYLVHTVVRGTRYLRVSLMNAQTELSDLQGLLEEVRTVAKEI